MAKWSRFIKWPAIRSWCFLSCFHNHPCMTKLAFSCPLLELSVASSSGNESSIPPACFGTFIFLR